MSRYQEKRQKMAGFHASSRDLSATASELRKWALEEMKFRPQGRHVSSSVPTEDEFKLICCGNMMQIWSYVLDNVRSAKTVQKVQGNLRLQGIKSQSCAKDKDAGKKERGDLKAKHSRLVQELTELTNKVTDVEKEIQHIKNDIVSSEKGCTDYHQDIDESKKRICLVTAQSRNSSDHAKIYKEYHQLIQKKLDKNKELARRASPTSFLELQAGTPCKENYHTTGASTGDGLESACSRSVRQATDSILSYLKNVYEESLTGDSPDNRSNKWEEDKKRTWSAVESTMSSHPPATIFSSLNGMIQDSTTGLQDLSNRIDLKQDAEDLKFRYESGSFSDVSSTPSVLQSVRQLIKAGQEAHFQRFLECERALNVVYKSRKELAVIKEKLESRFSEQFKNSDNQVINLVNNVFYTKLELASAKAAQEYLEKEIQRLKLSYQDKEAALQTLYDKHNRIQDFEKLVQMKQNLLQTLIKQNSNSKITLLQLQNEIRSYVQSTVCSHEDEITNVTEKLTDGAKEELSKFSELPLERMVFASMESSRRVPLPDLSIHRLDYITDTPMENILHALHFPLYKAPDELLKQVLDLKIEVDNVRHSLQTKQDIVKAMTRDSSSAVLSTTLQDLSDQVKDHDKEQMDRVMPVVERALSQSTRALTDFITLKDAVSSWWDQPAKDAVPWVTVDKHNIRQWTDRWTVAATKLRQLKIEQR